jgi:uncharacterized membrane protein YeaQ/YmgE (transglycosylase-associated protein family)
MLVQVGPGGCLQCLWVIIVGGTAGFLAGQVIRGKGYNPIGNVLLGMAGFLVGSLLFGRMGQAGLCGAILVSFVGALVLIVGVRVFLDQDFAK